jgi:hypothetical protein
MQIKVISSQQEAKSIFLRLLGVDFTLAIIFVFVHILVPEIRMGLIRPLSNLSFDLSIPAWYSAIKLFVVGALLFIASRNNQYNRYLPSSFLMGLSILFTFLSADEGAAIHEKITSTVKVLNLDWLLIRGHGAWIIIYSIISFPLIWLFIRYFRRAWKYFRRETIMALCGVSVFVTGAVILEIISYLFLRSGSTPVLYLIEVVFEEFFEMSGVSIILYSALLLNNTITISSLSSPGVSINKYHLEKLDR